MNYYWNFAILNNERIFFLLNLNNNEEYNMKEMVGGCCVCSDERGWPDNPLVYCDGNGCTVAVHQACYGIVTVPTGPWFCRKCESPEFKGKVRCELCPSKSGALKRTDTGGWAHVVCALYIPEVRFGNVTSMEPIVLRLIPPERYNKTCYICQDLGKSHRANAGACMQCNKSGCKQQFHVTCAQSLGLLCEEAGNYLDNVKYCGYCQHHYSKLKKGGNVKTIPPYKPVSHESHSSDSSEKEGEASPMASGSGTPTHPAKAKGSRKSSHNSSVISGKNTPNASKTPTNSGQQMESGPEPMEQAPSSRKHKSADKHADSGQEGEQQTSSRKHKSADKHKKKPSPSRRGSSTGDTTGSGSKNSTPAPSPQHSAPEQTPPPPVKVSPASNTAHNIPINTAKIPLPASPPTVKPAESAAVVNSTAAPTPTVSSTTVTTTNTTPVCLSMVPLPPSKGPTYQDSVITNMDNVETKQTKKRKALSAASTPTRPVDYAATPPHSAPSDMSAPNSTPVWEGAHPTTDVQMDSVDKVVKKAKTEEPPPVSHFPNLSPAPPPPPPPPAHSPALMPSPRHLPSPKPGPSGINSVTNMRSPSQLQGGKSERDTATSLLVSVPLPSASQGLNLTAHSQGPISIAHTTAYHEYHLLTMPLSELPGPSSHVFHQPPKQAAMDPGVPSHSPHALPGRSTWGGLNVSYEMQQDISKPGVSGVAGTSKDSIAPAMSPVPGAIRNKKRTAVSSTLVSMSTVPPPTPLQSPSAHNLANIRRPPQATPPPMYQDIKDSPPSSPNSERPLKPKIEHNVYSRIGANCTAPHMLGNELNPESGAAARLQEQLSAELAAHAAGGIGVEPLVPPPLINRAAPGSWPGEGNAAIAGVSGLSGRGATSSAQSLDQLLERQWEQGSQFLMEQAQHFDIASLLSCLHQLRTENVRLEEHVGSLLQRRDHLLAVNARLAIPLTADLCAVAAGPPEPSRCMRDVAQLRATPGPVRPNETITSERSHQLIMREVQQQKPS
ncbi:protein AF-10 isoform X2 [Papilio machaon]|uniref:protein AF-10 isoform X2 n=1 Tax=Papilio machaon TaxID=76193 RepID=UPI001E663393|nr:protein AF-10 isoform X2 [Papilio machaon]